MTISENIITYFDEYIKNYTPYKDNKFYSAIIEHIKNDLMNHLYNTNPSQFKSLYENNLVPIEVTQTLLIQLGVPEEVLNKLLISDQIVFLQALSNFFRYKGSIDFFKKVSKVFSDNFDFYELYIDYDESSNTWVCKPYMIIGDPDFHDTIPYSQIYNEVPSTLVSESQLTNYKNNHEIVLPLKSNLLLLKYSFIQEINEFLNLIVATFMKQYGNNQLTIYFSDGSYSASINQLIYIWFYVILKLYDGVWPAYELNKINILLPVFNPYTLQDIDELFNEYNELDNSVDALTFFNEHITLFFNYTYITSETTADDMGNNINSNIRDYLINRFNNINPNFIKSEYSQILNELLNSFVLYSYIQPDNMYIKYYEYIINFLPQIIIDPKETKSYLILSNFKPFHTELITQQIQYLKIKSKFDLVTPKTIYKFAMQLSNIDAYSIIDQYNAIIHYNTIDNLNTIENINYQVTNIYKYFFDITERLNLITKYQHVMLLNIFDELITYNSLYRGSSTLSLVDLISGLYVYLNRLDDINMQDSNTNNNIIYTKSTILNIFDAYQIYIVD